MEINDILKLLDLDQAEINALTDKIGLYNNTTTGSLEYNGSEIGGGGTPEAMSIVSLSSTDISTSINQSSPTILDWDVEIYKDSGFSHSNITNNSRIEVDDDGTYEIEANIRMESSDQRAQFVVKILIDGVVQSQPYGSSYIRNNGSSSDFWTCVVNPPPLKLTTGQYIEVQIQIESQTTTAITGTFIGTSSSFSMVHLQGTKGDAGATGAGSNIIIQEDDSAVGTVTSKLNFEGFKSVTDEGSNKTTVINTGYYHLKDNNTSGGTIDAPFDSLLECIPSSGTLEVTVPVAGVYIIGGKVDIGTDLNKDNGSIQLMYGIDGAVGTLTDARQNQNGKKNRRNGIQGTWGDVTLTAGQVITLFLSTLDDSASWDNGEIWIATWG
jgi:hypothetical protein